MHVEKGPEVSFNFFHFTCQEFLAAYYISLILPEAQQKVFNQYRHFEVVWWLMAGLTSFRHIKWESINKRTQRLHRSGWTQITA